MKTIESLGVFWTFQDASSGDIYQDEVSGLIFYGYWYDFAKDICKDLCSFELIWNGYAEVRPRIWGGSFISDFSLEIYIKSWPSDLLWKTYIEKSLRWFIKNGARVSWCGTECCSPSLEVFFPDNSAGTVYAAFNMEAGFACGAGLHEEFLELTSEELARFNPVPLLGQ